MADAVTSQTLVDNARNLVIKFTNFSDGTGESGVLKVNPASFTGVGVHMTIWRVSYDLRSGGLRVQWDATTPIDILILSDNSGGMLDMQCYGGITNNGGAGATGGIKFTTVAFTANSSYTVILELKKNT